ncbi:MAG: PadR family transcriptional regulator [Anaerofustis sp.]
MKKSKTKYPILGLLAEQPMSGYDIKKLIDVRFSFFWNESYGQIYPELKRLTESGEIELIEDAASEGREKTVYRITESGRDALRKWLAEPSEKASVRLELLLKVYFAQNGNTEDILNQIELFREEHTQQLAMLNLFEKELTPIREYDNHEDILRVLSFGQKTYRAYLEWCDETIQYMESRNPS